MAVSTRILYNPSSISGGLHLANAVRYTTLAQQELALAKAVADQVTAGGVTPANLEGSAEFGAPAAGGASLYTAIGNLNTNLATVTSASLAALYQG